MISAAQHQSQVDTLPGKLGEEKNKKSSVLIFDVHIDYILMYFQGRGNNLMKKLLKNGIIIIIILALLLFYYYYLQTEVNIGHKRAVLKHKKISGYSGEAVVSVKALQFNLTV